MDHEQGTDRNQMFMFCLESTIAKDSFVRVVDAFVDAITDFRKNHAKAFREVFRRFVCLLKEWNLN